MTGQVQADSLTAMIDDLPKIAPGPSNSLCDIAGLRVGSAEDDRARTGVTVIVPDSPAIAACAVQGGGPGTRETDALKPENLVDRADAVVLAGGSVFGLEAASTVTKLLADQGRGYPTGAPLPSPIVPAAILFDMANGGDKSWGLNSPYPALAHQAFETCGGPVRLGNAGAGYGAMAGQLKGGQGSASAVLDGTGTVAALIAANPLGAVVDAHGRFFAQPLALSDAQGLEFGDQHLAATPADIGARHPLAGSKLAGLAAAQNTSIGVVAVEHGLTVAEAQRLALMAQDGLARAIRPIHTPFDGDTIFVLATGARPLADDPALRPAALAVLGALAADCVARAVARAVWEAETLPDMMAYREAYNLSE